MANDNIGIIEKPTDAPATRKDRASSVTTRDVVVPPDGLIDLRVFGCKSDDRVRVTVVGDEVNDPTSQDLTDPVGMMDWELLNGCDEERMLRKFGTARYVSPERQEEQEERTRELMGELRARDGGGDGA